MGLVPLKKNAKKIRMESSGGRGDKPLVSMVAETGASHYTIALKGLLINAKK